MDDLEGHIENGFILCREAGLVLCSALMLSAVVPQPAVAQAPGSLDTSFDPSRQWQINGRIRVVAKQADGRYVVGGEFTKVGSTNRNGIARINADGSPDASFNPGAGLPGIVATDITGTHGVFGLALQSDGKILIGGQFDTFNGTNRLRLARLQNNGSLDTGFNPILSGDGVYAIAVQPDGRIVIAGQIDGVNGYAVANVARLNTNGTTDIGFDAGLGANNSVETVALQTDGRILIGGLFDDVDGLQRNLFARLQSDGHLDEEFYDEMDLNGNSVACLALQPDGRILVGGAFTSVNGFTRRNIVRFNPCDGSLDMSFSNTPNSSVYAVVPQPDGRILIGGGFASVNGTNSFRFARIEKNGAYDASFNVGVGFSDPADPNVHAILIASNKTLAGGMFTKYDNVSRTNLALINLGTISNNTAPVITEGAQWALAARENTATNVTIHATDADGHTLTWSICTPALHGTASASGTGTSKTVTYAPATNYEGADSFVAQVDDAHGGTAVITVFATVAGNSVLGPGDLVPSFFPGGKRGVDGRVRKAVRQSTGKIVIAGEFTRVGTTTRNGIARLNADGSLDLSFDPGAGLPGIDPTLPDGSKAGVFGMDIQSNDKIIIGGLFDTFNGTNVVRLARLYPDGALDTTFNPGLSGNGVYAVAVQSDNKILIGGLIDSVASVPRVNIARLQPDGSLDASFSTGDGVNNSVETIAMQSDGKVLIGGSFDEVDGLWRSLFARLNANGRVDESFYDEMDMIGSYVHAIAAQNDGRVLIGGSFSSINGAARSNVARLNAYDGSLDASFTNSANSVVHAIDIQRDGRILIAGEFASVNNNTNYHQLARLNGDGSLDTSFDMGAGPDHSDAMPQANLYDMLIVNSNVVIGGDLYRYDNVRRKKTALVYLGALSNNVDPVITEGAQWTLAARENAPTNATLHATDGDGNTISWSISTPARHGSAAASGTGTSKATTYAPATNYWGRDSFVVQVSDSRGGLDSITVNVDVQGRHPYFAGALNEAFYPGGERGLNGRVRAIALHDNKLILGGEFTRFGDVPRNGIVRLALDGELDAGFDPGDGLPGIDPTLPSSDQGVYCVGVQSGGKILIGGKFQTYDGTAVRLLARLNADGSLDPAFVPNLTGVGVYAMKVLTNDQVLIAGQIDKVGVTNRVNIARLNANGTLDASFDPGAGPNNSVEDLAVQPDGRIVIGGSFSQVRGTNRTLLARLNVNGTLDAAFMNGVSITGTKLSTVALQGDGRALLGGVFTAVGGTNVKYMARFNTNGTLDTSFNMGTGPNGEVNVITLQPDGKILAGGQFANVNGNTNYHQIVRLLTNGTIDTKFDIGAGPGWSKDMPEATVHAMLLCGETCCIGGDFAYYDGYRRRKFAQIHVQNERPLQFYDTSAGSGILSLRWVYMPETDELTNAVLVKAQANHDLLSTGSWSTIWQTNLGPKAGTLIGGFSDPITNAIRFYRMLRQ